jgi:hypothetical protein
VSALVRVCAAFTRRATRAYVRDTGLLRAVDRWQLIRHDNYELCLIRHQRSPK